MPIRIREAAKRYLGKQALSDINLEFEKDHIYGIFGENGAGKSTLLDAIAGRMILNAGDVSVDGEPLFNNSNALEKIALARPGEAYPPGTRVRTALKEAAMLRPNFNMDYALQAAKACAIDPNARVSSLSTGRNALLRNVIALASGADYVLLDEPTLGLDVSSRKLLYREIVKDFGESGRTYIIASHQIAEIANIIDQAVILHGGRIAAHAPLDQMLESVFTISGPRALLAETLDDVEVISAEIAGGFATAIVRMPSCNESPHFPKGLTIAQTGMQEYVEAMCHQKIEGEITC